MHVLSSWFKNLIPISLSDNSIPVSISADNFNINHICDIKPDISRCYRDNTVSGTSKPDTILQIYTRIRQYLKPWLNSIIDLTHHTTNQDPFLDYLLILNLTTF